MLRQLLHSVASDDARETMVREQIAARGIRDPRVIEALREVPRHSFVPEPERSRAYDDGPVSIGQGHTISQPYIVALMTELLRPQPGDRVLEVGTGSGYQAAVLARLATEVHARIAAALEDPRPGRGGEPTPA